MIDLQAAEQLLDFSRRLGNDPSAHARAREQLAGAVAIHNLLEKNGVAYLADEVGMGKTYVALGAMALFRHFKPDFRVMVISPRRNIQQKWVNELRNFIEHNVLVNDLRVRGVDGRPARPTISCDNLIELVSESVLDPDRDFFGRITSFSLGLGGKNEIDARRCGAPSRRHPEIRAMAFQRSLRPAQPAEIQGQRRPGHLLRVAGVRSTHRGRGPQSKAWVSDELGGAKPGDGARVRASHRNGEQQAVPGLRS